MTATIRPIPARRRSLLVRAGALTFAAALALTACASGTAGTSAGAAAPETSPMASGDAAAPGESMASADATPSGGAMASDDAMAAGPLAFTASTVSGGSLDVSTLEGKPVVFWFWAPWCTICRGEAPSVSSIAAELGDEVTFVGVAGLGELDAMKGFVSDTKVSGFEQLADVDGSIWSRFGVVSQPSFVFVAADGSVTKVAGSLGSDALRERATALVGG